MNRTWIGWTAALVIAMGIGNLARAQSKVSKLAEEGYWGKSETKEAHFQLIDKPMPQLTLTDWRGKEVKAADMKDKIVVVDFWATWCGPCKTAVPHNNEIQKKYADKGILVIGACGGSGEDKMNAVADQTKMEYPTGKAAKEVVQAWGVRWWPHYVVVDKKGTIRAIGIKPNFVEKVIEALLEEK